MAAEDSLTWPFRRNRRGRRGSSSASHAGAQTVGQRQDVHQDNHPSHAGFTQKGGPRCVPAAKVEEELRQKTSLWLWPGEEKRESTCILTPQEPWSSPFRLMTQPGTWRGREGIPPPLSPSQSLQEGATPCWIKMFLSAAVYKLLFQYPQPFLFSWFIPFISVHYTPLQVFGNIQDGLGSREEKRIGLERGIIRLA